MPDIKQLADILKTGDEEQARKALATIPSLEFEMLRKPLADEAGIRPTALDKLRAVKPVNDSMQGKGLNLEDPEPSPVPQEGAQLLDDVAGQIRRFLIADESSIVGMTLWIAWAYIVDIAPVSPNVVYSSPLRACGKSTGLDVTGRLTPRTLTVSGISPAALFRCIAAMKPTLIIDEADTIFRENDELRTLLNAGFTRTAARVVRVVGEELEPRLFSTWGAKALALIGKLPDTLASRSVIIPMRRKKTDEKTERLRSDIDQGFGELRARLARWTLDNGDSMVMADPEIPASLSDRQGDCWRELLRMADCAGGEWPSRARLAAVQICGRADDEEGDISTRLLLDVKSLFDTDATRTSWPSSRIVEYLNSLEGSPWPDFDHGQGMKPPKLGRLLGRFGITSKTIRATSGTPKGYTVASFDEVFSRYLPNKRNTAANDDKSLQNKDIKCGGIVSVAVPKRNIDEAAGNCGGTEAQQQHEAQQVKTLHNIELSENVALLRQNTREDENDPLYLLDGLFDEAVDA